MAQEITGVPGSPDATRTIDGKELPAPPLPFGGVIKENAAQSKPWWPPRIVPPKGAPNILLIMTDDVGFLRPEHIRRRDSDSGSRPYCKRRTPLHEFSFHIPLLPDSGCADHWP